MGSWNVSRQTFFELPCFSIHLHSANVIDRLKLIPFSGYVLSTYYIFRALMENAHWLFSVSAELLYKQMTCGPQGTPFTDPSDELKSKTPLSYQQLHLFCAL